MPIRLELPARYLRWVTPREWLQVGAADQPSLVFKGRRHPLTLHPLPAALGDTELRDFIARLPPRPGTLVVGSLIPRRARSLLEASEAGYLDSRGNLHLVSGAGVIHVEASPGASRERAAGLGAHGVRAIQALLVNAGPVSVSGLATRVSLSLSQTHSVLELLEASGLVQSTGTGPSRRRLVADRTALLDWLQAQPVARRAEQRLDVAVYARRPEELWALVEGKLAGAGVRHALTGGAAAALFGFGPSNVLTSAVRIDPDLRLETVAATLGARPTERGANLRLLRDTGRVGTGLTEERDSIRVAPQVRIYLDALGERRGEDVAQQFREAVLGF